MVMEFKFNGMRWINGEAFRCWFDGNWPFLLRFESALVAKVAIFFWICGAWVSCRLHSSVLTSGVSYRFVDAGSPETVYVPGSFSAKAKSKSSSTSSAQLAASFDKSVLQISDWLNLEQNMLKKESIEVGNLDEIAKAIDNQKVCDFKCDAFRSFPIENFPFSRMSFVSWTLRSLSWTTWFKWPKISRPTPIDNSFKTKVSPVHRFVGREKWPKRIHCSNSTRCPRRDINKDQWIETHVTVVKLNQRNHHRR